MFNHASVKTKLTLLAFASGCLCFLLSAFLLYELSSISRSFHNIAVKNVQALEAMEETDTVLLATQQIGHAIQEQKQANDEISRNVRQVADMANEETEAMHGVALAVEQVSAMTVQLSTLVHRFKLS